jgi:ribonuclease HI
MAVNQLGDGSPDGVIVGATAEGKVGFYGTTPIAKVSLTQQATTKTTTQLRAELTALQNALHNLGLITIT